MDVVSSLEEIVIKEPINIVLAQKRSKDDIVDLVIEIHIKESNHAEKPYIKAIQDMDIFYGDLISNKKEESVNFEVVLRIKQQQNMLC